MTDLDRFNTANAVKIRHLLASTALSVEEYQSSYFKVKPVMIFAKQVIGLLKAAGFTVDEVEDIDNGGLILMLHAK